MTQTPQAKPEGPNPPGLVAQIVARVAYGREPNSINALAMGCIAVVVMCLGLALYYKQIVGYVICGVIAVGAAILGAGLLAAARAARHTADPHQDDADQDEPDR